MTHHAAQERGQECACNVSGGREALPEWRKGAVRSTLGPCAGPSGAESYTGRRSSQFHSPQFSQKG